MTTQQMQYFLEVARLKSFTAAAEVFFTTQPSISRQIASMESELGVKLFLRRNNIIELTPAGRALYHGLDRVYSGFTHLIGDVKQIALGAHQHLRVGILPDQRLDPTVMAALDALFALQPRLDLDFARDRNLYLMDGLQEGMLDVAITFSYPAERGLHATLLRHDPMYLAVHRRHVPEDLTTLRLRDYSAHFGALPLICNHPNVSNQQEINQALDQKRLSFLLEFGLPEPQIASCAEALVLMVCAGRGAAVVNGQNVLSIEPDVVMLPLTDLTGVQGMPIVALTNPEHPNPLVEEFLKLLPQAKRAL